MPNQLEQFLQDMTLSEKSTIANIMFSVVMSGGRVAPTGSRIIGHHNPGESDFDFIITTPRVYQLKDWFLREASGWSDTGSAAYQDRGDTFTSLRKGRLNVILMNDVQGFDRWLQATDLCISLGVQTKQERVAVFDYVISGQTGGLLSVLQSIRPTTGRVDGDPEFPDTGPVSRRSPYDLRAYVESPISAGSARVF